jgi:hypothetical protein
MAEKLVNDTENALLLILAEVLGGNEKTCGTAECDFGEFIRLAKAHVVLSIIGDRLLLDESFSSMMTEAQTNEVKKRCESVLVSSNMLLYLTDRCLKRLDEAGINTVVLKGWAVAGYYPVPELRKTGDIDILVADGDVNRAVEIIKKDGFREVSDQHSVHHVELANGEGIEIEVHNMFVEPFEDEAVNRLVRQYGAEMLAHTEYFDYNGYRIRRGTAAYNALSLILHMLQHYLRAGFGLKLLCDWVVFIDKGMDATEYARFAKMSESLGISGFVKMINSVCHRFLGMKLADGMDIITDEGTLEAFMSDVLEGEEFGRSGAHRMVVVHGKGLGAYFREFNHQTKLNNPKLSKIWILMPFLWVKTLIVFIINNKMVRNTKTSDILKTAGRRGKLVAKMGLFSK